MDTYYSDQTAVRQHESGLWIIGPERHTLATDVMAYDSREEALATLPPGEWLVPVQDLRRGDVITMDAAGPGPCRDEVLSVWLDPHGPSARVTVWWGTAYTSRSILAKLHGA